MTSPDHVALLPLYLAAGTAVAALLADLLTGRRGAVLGAALLGAAATGAAAAWVAAGPVRQTFCGARAPDDCSYVAGPLGGLVAAAFALLTVAVLALSAPLLRAGVAPAGEYCFLLACAMTGGVALGYAGDLITLIVALETLTLPLYVLVALRDRPLRSKPPRTDPADATGPSAVARPAGVAGSPSTAAPAGVTGPAVRAAEGSVVFFVVSVVATAVTLLGAALLYATTGALHLRLLGAALDDRPELAEQPLAAVAVALLVAGLAFKVAAVPFHAWAPAAYDGAPLPVAAYLSTASKLGGVVALLYVCTEALPPAATGPLLAGLAVLTMTVGNLVALRQRRLVRLLAWSSVAQVGYILAPLGAAVSAAGRTPEALAGAAAATVAYALFFVLIELGAFAAVVALRPTGADGGALAEQRGAARRAPWAASGLAVALVGLAGVPPGLAGLFAKVVVVRALLEGAAGWLAVAVAVNAVIGLAYYLRLAASLYAPAPASEAVPAAPAVPTRPRVPWPVAVTLAVATALAVVAGVAPQLVLDLAALAPR
ncbi:MAG TPA: proton-conducting transporter membrane subunit [Pilimelia sp.]|nr:proton-conducting transporter membrane subunit [Pilimelia sp.]